MMNCCSQGLVTAGAAKPPFILLRGWKFLINEKASRIINAVQDNVPGNTGR
jgi:hypothetical protein